MITHLIKSINWVDVALFLLILQVIFLGVKNGFICEFFKCLGILAAVFVSLHYYSTFAAWIAAKTHITWIYWDAVIFGALWLAVTFFFKFFRDGILLLFKVETNHQGFDKYASGVLAVGRGLLVCSMTIILILLVQNGPLSRMTLTSYSYKIAGQAAVSTYSFLYNKLIGKFCVGEHYNPAASKVLHPDGK
jgi:uncharacterized membrane protein required for colicin V production